MDNLQVNQFAAQSLSKLCLKPDFADVYFTFPKDGQNDEVPAHKSILAAASPVFAAMFFGPLKEDKVVKIADSTAAAFKEFLQLIYKPKVQLTWANIGEVVRLIDKYDMFDCADTCTAFIERNLTDEHLVMGYQMAILLKSSTLISRCERRIQVFTTTVLKSPAFLQCNREVLERVLRMGSLRCNEVELFDACIEWAKSWCQANGLDADASDNLRHQLGHCFYSIRFGAMDGEDISKILSNQLYNGLFDRDELTDIMLTKFDPKFQSEMFGRVPRYDPLNESTQLICRRQNGTHPLPCYIGSHEATVFSSSESLLLTRIRFCAISYSNFLDSSHSLDAIVSIMEGEKKLTPVPKAPFTEILKISCQIGKDNDLILASPIIINTSKMYVIRLDIKNASNYCHTFTWASKVKLNDEITITFHRNFHNADNIRRGLVSALVFHAL